MEILLSEEILKVKYLKIYYLSQKRKIKAGIWFILFAILIILPPFTVLKIENSEDLKAIIISSCFSFIFFQAGISFFLLKKNPLLVFRENDFLYHQHLMPINTYEKVPIIFPYWRGSFMNKLKYSEIKTFEVQENVLLETEIFFKFKDPKSSPFAQDNSSIHHEKAKLSLNRFSKKEQKEIISFLKAEVHRKL